MEVELTKLTVGQRRKRGVENYSKAVLDIWKEEAAVDTDREDWEIQVVQAKGQPSRVELLKRCTLQTEAGPQHWPLASSWKTTSESLEYSAQQECLCMSEGLGHAAPV